MNDDARFALVKRLARPDSSGGAVIERAAILAEGADFASVMAWIENHDRHPNLALLRSPPEASTDHGSAAPA
jgi:hypothetical protein